MISMPKEKGGKQVTIRFNRGEWSQLGPVYQRVYERTEAPLAKVIKELMGLRPRKLLTEEEFLYFHRRSSAVVPLSNPELEPETPIAARRGDKIRIRKVEDDMSTPKSRKGRSAAMG